MTYQLKAIGKVKNDENGTFIQLEPEYISGRAGDRVANTPMTSGAPL